MVWEFVFLMVILKIPVIYLCLVVYWAIRGDRGPAEAARLSPIMSRALDIGLRGSQDDGQHPTVPRRYRCAKIAGGRCWATGKTDPRAT